MFRRSHDRDASLFGILAAACTALRDGKDVMNRIVRYLMLAGAWTACIIGCIGVFVPVLPTTPLLLLATFLFAKSSPRCHAWIISTGCTAPTSPAFKEAGGIPLGTEGAHPGRVVHAHGPVRLVRAEAPRLGYPRMRQRVFAVSHVRAHPHHHPRARPADPPGRKGRVRISQEAGTSSNGNNRPVW